MSSTSEAQQAGHDTGSNVSGNLEMTGTSPQVEVRTGDEMKLSIQNQMPPVQYELHLTKT